MYQCTSMGDCVGIPLQQSPITPNPDELLQNTIWYFGFIQGPMGVMGKKMETAV